MKMSSLNELKLISTEEIANEAGITLEDLIKIAQEDGLIDADGMPTEYAISEGILTVEIFLENL